MIPDENTTAEIAESAPAQEVEAVEEAESAPAQSETVQNDEPDKRTKELIAQRKRRQEAEKDAAYWKGVAEARGNTTPVAKAPQAPLNFGPPAEPNPDSYDTWDAYERANKEHIIQMAEYRIQARMLQQQRDQYETKVVQEFTSRINSDPVVAAIAQDDTLPISPAMATIIKTSDTAPEILRYLDKHRNEAKRIAALNPVSAGREMGKIEAQLSLAPRPDVKKVSAAPNPLQTVSSNSGSVGNDDDLPMDEYYKRYTKRVHGRS
jgi:hypothetical protein